MRPTDELRDELVPINRKWPIREVIAAGRRFAARTGRRVSLEYVMIDGLNDTEEQADGLIELARGWRSHVNLIPLNPTPGSRWSGTPAAGIERFVRRLRDGGVSVTVRDTRGREIDAACGQLHAQLIGRSLREAREAAATAPGVVSAEPQISASILTADFARLGDEVRRAADGGVESVHLDVMDGHFVDNLTLGPVVVGRRAARHRPAVPHPPDDQQPTRVRRALRRCGERPDHLPRRSR